MNIQMLNFSPNFKWMCQLEETVLDFQRLYKHTVLGPWLVDWFMWKESGWYDGQMFRQVYPLSKFAVADIWILHLVRLWHWWKFNDVFSWSATVVMLRVVHVNVTHSTDMTRHCILPFMTI